MFLRSQTNMPPWPAVNKYWPSLLNSMALIWPWCPAKVCMFVKVVISQRWQHLSLRSPAVANIIYPAVAALTQLIAPLCAGISLIFWRVFRSQTFIFLIDVVYIWFPIVVISYIACECAFSIIWSIIHGEFSSFSGITSGELSSDVLFFCPLFFLD